MSNLIAVRIQRCKFTNIAKNAFSLLQNFEKLYFSENSSTTIEVTWFEKSIPLTYLGLYENNIENIEDGAFSSLTQLHILNLRKNRLKEVGDRCFGSQNRNTSVSFAKLVDL